MLACLHRGMHRVCYITIRMNLLYGTIDHDIAHRGNISYLRKSVLGLRLEFLKHVQHRGAAMTIACCGGLEGARC